MSIEETEEARGRLLPLRVSLRQNSVNEYMPHCSSCCSNFKLSRIFSHHFNIWSERNVLTNKERKGIINANDGMTRRV